MKDKYICESCGEPFKPKEEDDIYCIWCDGDNDGFAGMGADSNMGAN